MAGWTHLNELVRREFEQSLQEGKSPDGIAALRGEFERAGRDETLLAAISARLIALPVSADFPYREPDDLVGIQALRKNRVTFSVPPLDAALENKMLGAWLGRCAGCALGKPVELIGLWAPACTRQRTWRDIKHYLTAIHPDEWPLRDYVPPHSPAEKDLPRVIGLLSNREVIAFMESDDDIRYTIIGQLVLRQHAAAFTTGDVAEKWMQKLPYRAVCTAETQAYRNLILRYDFHEGNAWKLGPLPVDWNWVATHLNPYREWIGAQIRVDSYGYAAPGQPELAADFAWRDARLSHVKNGLYGAMLCAAMIAAAFTATDVREIVAAGLGEIPATSRLHAELSQVIALCEKFDCRHEHFEEIFDGICDIVGHYSTTHTNNNAAVCVATLLLSGGDFHRGITLAVMAGFDTDCNGATVGSILGAFNGAARLPEHWTGRLHDTLKSEIADYHPVAISECARRSMEIVRRLRAS
jgi:ADP-ribosylglycohydrolase